MTKKEHKKLVNKARFSPRWPSNIELAQLRRSSRTGEPLLSVVVTEQARRGLLRENWRGTGYAPEILKNVEDYHFTETLLTIKKMKKEQGSAGQLPLSKGGGLQETRFPAIG